MLALSDCGNYVGLPTPGSGWGIWFYLQGQNNPFQELIEEL